jgi:uncharacterized protein (TIGR03437 family)
MKLAALLFPVLWWGGAFIDGVSSPGGLAPGGFAEIDGAYFDGTAKVTVGGLDAAVYPYGEYPCAGCEVVIFIQIPSGVALGPTSLVLTQGNDVVIRPVRIVPAAPGFASTFQPPFIPNGFPPNVRIERSLPGGGFGPWTCSPGDTPQPGDLVRLYMTGLGATNPLVPAGVPAPESPLAGTIIKPTVLFAKRPAEVTESVLVPGQVGVYRVTFKLPDYSGYQTLSVTSAGVTVETPIPVGKAINPLQGSASPLSIQAVTACGGHFLDAGQTLSGDIANPPKKLGDISIAVFDSIGGERDAGILSATQDQIEYLIPDDFASGTADVNITIGPTTWRGTIEIKSFAPRVLEVAPGIAAAYLVRVSNGVQTIEPTFHATVDGKYEAVPIDLGPPGDAVYLCVFGTGWRWRASLADFTLDLSRDDGTYLRIPAVYAGPEGAYAGIDQANFLLPRSLAGSGNRYALHTFLNAGGTRTGLPGLFYK